jgi:hypothetical protein
MAVNMIEILKDQVTGPMLTHLSSLIGMSEETTRNCVGAAVPTLMGSFSNLASTGGGAEKLAGALKRFDPQAPGSLSGLLDERPERMAEKGSGIAESLLGSSAVSGILHPLSRSFGIGSGAAGRLLGFLTPVVLGGIARQFSGRTIDAGSVTFFFSEQKRNIDLALPAEISGAKAVAKEGVSRAATPARFAEPVVPSGRWLLPAVIGLAAVAIAVFLMRSKPTPTRLETPDAATRLDSDLRTTVGSLTNTLSGITDAASAEAAVPRIEEAKGKLDEIRSQAAELPKEGRAAFEQVIRQNLKTLEEQSRRLASIPGAEEKIKPALDEVLSRLSAPVGAPPAERGEQVR